MILGKGQPDSHVDRRRARTWGLEVARRASGGSAVLVGPGLQVWLDVVVPAGDPLWCDDVSRAAGWIGDAWVAALGAVGVSGARAHRGAMHRGPWAERVCFDSLASGEVAVDGRKVVGLAQRRTRDWALFQCAVLLEWDPAPLADVVGLGPCLHDVAVGLDELVPGRSSAANEASVEAAFLHAVAV